jgi:excisionase family DNA binding protein
MRKRATPSLDLSQLQLLTVADTARLLCVGRTTVYALLNASAIQSVQIRGARRILAFSVWQYIERQKQVS